MRIPPGLQVNWDVKYILVKKCSFLSPAEQSSCQKHLARLLASGRLCLVLNQSQRLKVHTLQRTSQQGDFSVQVLISAFLRTFNRNGTSNWGFTVTCWLFCPTSADVGPVWASSQITVGMTQVNRAYPFRIRNKTPALVIKRKWRKTQHIQST